MHMALQSVDAIYLPTYGRVPFAMGMVSKSRSSSDRSDEDLSNLRNKRRAAAAAKRDNMRLSL